MLRPLQLLLSVFWKLAFPLSLSILGVRSLRALKGIFLFKMLLALCLLPVIEVSLRGTPSACLLLLRLLAFGWTPFTSFLLFLAAKLGSSLTIDYWCPRSLLGVAGHKMLFTTLNFGILLGGSLPGLRPSALVLVRTPQRCFGLTALPFLVKLIRSTLGFRSRCRRSLVPLSFRTPIMAMQV